MFKLLKLVKIQATIFGNVGEEVQSGDKSLQIKNEIGDVVGDDDSGEQPYSFILEQICKYHSTHFSSFIPQPIL